MNGPSIEFLDSRPALWIALLAPSLALAFWAYYRLIAPLSRPARWALWLLRGTAFAIVLFALTQPILTATTDEGGRPGLAVLVDRSASMALPAGGPDAGVRRADQAEEAVRQIREAAGERFRLDGYAFGERLEPLPLDSLALRSPDGGTALGGALEEAASRADARPVGGYVVLTDGINTAGRDPVRVAAAIGVPVFPVVVGADEPLADAEIRAVRSNPTAFAGEPWPLRVVVSSWGFGGRTARLQVTDGDRVLATREVALIGEKGVEQEIALDVRPTVSGLARYEVSLAGLGTDAVPQNDRRSVAVEVLERRTRVLVLSGRLDWDFTFLRRTLAADTTLAYTFLAQTRPGEYWQDGERRPADVPAALPALREYAVVILTGFEQRGPSPELLESLSRYTREGGGLLLLGGPPGPKGWTGSGTFAGLLPGALEADAPGFARALPVQLTLEGQRHPATAVRENPAETAREWSALPPVQRPGGSMTAFPDARVLLEYRGPRGGTAAALAVVQRDRGKAAWLHARGAWRWDFLPAGATGSTDLHRQFLLGLVRWLAEPTVREQFRVLPARRVFQNGEPGSVTAELWDDAYAPVRDARVQVEILAAGSPGEAVFASDLEPASEAGRYSIDFPALDPGEYLLRARAQTGLGSEVNATTRFWVEVMGPEFARSRPDYGTLEQLARRTGGTLVRASELGPLLRQLPEAVRPVGRVREWELWNHWLLFAAFVLVLSVEWMLRRRRGLA